LPQPSSLDALADGGRAAKQARNKHPQSVALVAKGRNEEGAGREDLLGWRCASWLNDLLTSFLDH